VPPINIGWETRGEFEIELVMERFKDVENPTLDLMRDRLIADANLPIWVKDVVQSAARQRSVTGRTRWSNDQIRDQASARALSRLCSRTGFVSVITLRLNELANLEVVTNIPFSAFATLRLQLKGLMEAKRRC
jgi:hypothetical protein